MTSMTPTPIRKLAKDKVKACCCVCILSMHITHKSEEMKEAQNLQGRFSYQLHSFLTGIITKEVVHYTTSGYKLWFSVTCHHWTCLYISSSLWMELHVLIYRGSSLHLVFFPPSIAPLLFVSIVICYICSLQFKCIWICTSSDGPLFQVILVIYFCNICPIKKKIHHLSLVLTSLVVFSYLYFRFICVMLIYLLISIC